MFSDIFTLPRLRQLEHLAVNKNINLMAQAAQVIFNWITHYYPKAHVLMAVGTGNNGGDALCCAKLLAQHNIKVTLWVPETPKTDESIQAFNECKQLNLPVIEQFNQLPELPDLIVDGFFGIGLNRNLDQNWQDRINQINRCGIDVLAIDTPSGLDAYRGIIYGAAVKAHTTLTFICAKPGLHTNEGVDQSGKVFVAALNIPNAIIPESSGTIAPSQEASQLKRVANCHKGTFGSIGVIGGAKSMLGAAILCARTSLYCGAGKVYVGTLGDYQVDPIAPELMFSTAEHILEQDIQVMAIGPGLSVQDRAKACLEKALGLPIKKVLDADALNLISQNHDLEDYFTEQNNTEIILTPHPTEAARLLKTSTSLIQANRVKAAQQLAHKFNATVILKGCGSIIARPDGFYRVNTSGSATLASGGQGDVLTGICAALLGQGLDAFEAASISAYVHGLAGEHYARKKGQIGLSASKTIEIIKHYLNKLIEQEN
ncbi:NAD(P)H-hydrate dehydratase [Neisseria sp. Ec49-e6-T10]|uniref:NAD(P)H-hydrate dehydratase n=1 Tax=Neisseria sp. Ec49-e6-T10 TaxID=3140744 RepID=UPI003EBD1943